LFPDKTYAHKKGEHGSFITTEHPKEWEVGTLKNSFKLLSQIEISKTNLSIQVNFK